MDASTLTPDERRELASLRLRAYGPLADIQSDPTALTRLAQLEDRLHVGPIPVAHTAPVLPGAEVRLGPLPGGAAAMTSDERRVREAPADAEDDDGTAPERQWRGRTGAELAGRWRARVRRVPMMGWIIGAAAFAVILSIVWAVGQLTLLRPDVELQPLADSEPPSEFARQGLLGNYPMDAELFQQYESFRSLDIWSAEDESGHRCLVITTPEFQRLGSAATCAPPGLDPTYDFSIWPGLPETVTGGLSRGSVIRFVLHDERVNVWVRQGSGSPDPE